jgi:hypothetical protein
MTPEEDILRLLYRAFPVVPIPQVFFWSELVDETGEFYQDFTNFFAGRPWTETSIDDWRMACLLGGAFRNYTKPSTFLYYIPPLIINALRGNLGDIQVALEEILPFNRNRVPRGKWWAEFVGEVSAEQRCVFSAFLAYLRAERFDQSDLEIEELVCAAEAIWSDPS